MRSARVLLGVLTFVFTLPVLALAQGTTADIVGRITDASGAVLPGATVTVSNGATGDTRTAVSGETGDYAFTLLPIGTYTVRIELQGFQVVTSRVTLASGDRSRVDAKMALGSVAENVTVTAEAPLLQTDSSSVSSLFNEKAVQDLPVAGRNITRLVQMVPGANEGAVSSLANGTRPDDRRQTSSVSINGTGDTQNNQLVDGLDNNERAIGTVGIKPSIDAIAEVKVQTNLYSADVGRTLGGVVNILTKSGTNTFHGTAYEFVRNDRFDARDFFARQDPILDQHQFGGSFGGPLRNDRTFFFLDYAQTLSGSTSTGCTRSSDVFGLLFVQSCQLQTQTVKNVLALICRYAGDGGVVSYQYPSLLRVLHQVVRKHTVVDYWLTIFG